MSKSSLVFSTFVVLYDQASLTARSYWSDSTGAGRISRLTVTFPDLSGYFASEVQTVHSNQSHRGKINDGPTK